MTKKRCSMWRVGNDAESCVTHKPEGSWVSSDWTLNLSLKPSLVTSLLVTCGTIDAVINIGKWPTNCLNMFDHFVGLTLKISTTSKGSSSFFYNMNEHDNEKTKKDVCTP